jgi:uncharacterized membrane protein
MGSWTRTLAALGAIGFLVFGIWAFADPESFFDHVANFEPYNQHLLQDIGAFQIGLGAALLLAVLAPHQDAMAIALLGAGAGAAVHVASHIIGHDLGGRPGTDIPIFVAQTLLLVVPGVVRWRANAARAPGISPSRDPGAPTPSR